MSQNKPAVNPPLWLLAELTYRCPLQCPYCSNPLDFARQDQELTTEQWIEVFRQARAMGSVQIGFSGGEPLTRKDLPELIRAARDLGFYTNLITSGIGLTESKLDAFSEAGLDHIQISFQASDEVLNAALAGNKKAFQQKLAMAKAVKARDYPMVLNFVLHRQISIRSIKSSNCASSWTPTTSNLPPASSTVGRSLIVRGFCRRGNRLPARNAWLPNIGKKWPPAAI